MGGAVSPPCCLTWGQGGNEDNDDLQRSHARPATLSASDPAAGHRQPTPLPEILGHSWACLGQFLWGHWSFLLDPDVHKVLFVPSTSLFPQFCGSSGGSPLLSLALVIASLPLCLRVGRGRYKASSPLVFAQSFVLWAGQAHRTWLLGYSLSGKVLFFAVMVRLVFCGLLFFFLQHSLPRTGLRP